MTSCYHQRKSKCMMTVFSQGGGMNIYSKGASLVKRSVQFRTSFTFAYLGGEVKIVLWRTVLILTIPQEQDLVWISAGGTAGL